MTRHRNRKRHRSPEIGPASTREDTLDADGTAPEPKPSIELDGQELRDKRDREIKEAFEEGTTLPFDITSLYHIPAAKTQADGQSESRLDKISVEPIDMVVLLSLAALVFVLIPGVGRATWPTLMVHLATDQMHTLFPPLTAESGGTPRKCDPEMDA